MHAPIHGMLLLTTVLTTLLITLPTPTTATTPTTLATTATPSICTALAAQMQNYPPKLDGFTTPPSTLSLASLLTHPCATVSEAETPLPAAALVLDSAALPAGVASATTTSVSRSVEGTTSDDGSFAITITLRFELDLTLENGDAPVAVAGTITATLASPFALPVVSLAELDVPWSGALSASSSAAAAVVVLDTAVFDSVPPFVLTSASLAASASGTAAAAAPPLDIAVLATSLADIGGAVTPSFGTLPTTVLASFRSAFYAPVASASTPKLIATGVLAGHTKPTSVYSFAASCDPCPHALTAAFELAASAPVSRVASTTTTTFALSPTLTTPLASSSASLALTPAGVYAATAVAALAPDAAAWPTPLLALNLAPTVRSASHGLAVAIDASVSAPLDTETQTRPLPLAPLVSGSAPSGVPLPDSPFDGASASAALAALASHLAATPGLAPALAAALPALFTPEASLTDTYAAATFAPSMSGFYAWLTHTALPPACAAAGLVCSAEFRPPLANATLATPVLALSLATGAAPHALATPPSALPACVAANIAPLAHAMAGHLALSGFEAPTLIAANVTSLSSAGSLTTTVALGADGAWSDVGAPHTLALTTLAVSTAAPRSLASSVTAYCSSAPAYGLTATLSEAAATAAKFGTASTTAFDDGAPTTTTSALTLTGAQASALASVLTPGADAVGTANDLAWANAPLGPTPITINTAGPHPTADYVTALVALLTSPGDTPLTGPGLAGALAAAHPLTAFDVALTSATQVTLRATTHVLAAQATLASEAAPWMALVDLSRMDLPLSFARTLVLESGAPTAPAVFARGATSAHAFAAPAKWELSNVAVTAGSLDLTLDLPAHSALTASLSGATDGLAGSMRGLTITIEDNNLIALSADAANATTPMSSDAFVGVTGYPYWPLPALLTADPLHAPAPVASLLPLLSGTPPTSLLTDLTTTLGALSSFAAGAADFPIPVLNAALNSVADVGEAVDEALSHLTWLGQLAPKLTYATVCAGTAASTEKFTFNINGAELPPFNCTFVLPATTAANLHSALDTALKTTLDACAVPGLGAVKASALLAHSVLAPYTQDASVCTMVSIAPRVPGTVSSFALTTTVRNPTMFPRESSWSATPAPLFASWADLPFLLLQSGIATSISHPRPISVAAKDVPSCVPAIAAWAPFFTDAIPGTSFGVSFNKTLVAKSATFAAHSLSSGPVSLDLPETSGAASIDAFVSADVAVVHGCAPLRSARNITIETAFSNETAPFATATVPPGGGLTLSASFVVRSADEGVPPERVEYSQFIALPAGMTVADALLHHLIPAVNSPEVAGVLGVTTLAVDPIFNPDSPQVEVAINAAINEQTGHLVIPYSLAISNITVPGIHGASPVMSQSRSLAGNMAIGLALDASAHTSAHTTGRLGPLALDASTLTSAASASLTLSATSPWLTTASALKAGTAASSLFSFFSLDAAVSASAAVSTIELDAFDVPIPGLPTLGIALTVDSAANLLSPGGLSDFVDGLDVHATHSWTGDDALVRMISALVSRNGTMCDLFTAGVSFIHDVQGTSVASTPLAPLAHSPFAHVLDKLVPVYTDAVTAVCSRGEPITVALFCSIMADLFHEQVGPVCSNVTLADSAFTVPLSFTPVSYSYATASVLDTQLFKGGHGLAVGTAASNNVAISASVTVQLTLVLNLAPGHTSVRLDPAGTGLTLAAHAADAGALKINFGPFQATVATSRAWLAATDAAGETEPATLRAHLPSASSTTPTVVLAGSAGFAATVSFPFVATDKCAVSVSVPSLATPSSAVASDAGCAAFTDDLRHVLSMSWMEEFFSRPGSFWSSFSSALASLRARMFGPNSPLGRHAIAFIDRKLGSLLDGDLAKITGPEVAANIIHQISVDMVDELAGIKLETTIEEIIVEIVTGALNEHLPYLASPVTASVDAATRSVTWTIEFGHTATRPLVSVNSDWGKHGALELDVHCSASLDAEWSFTVALEYSAASGISLTLPTEPAFKSSVTLSMPTGCSMVGGIGPLGAEIVTTPSDTFLNGQVNIEFAPTFAVDLVFNAQLGGTAELGAGPLIADLAHTTVENALMAFIHYQAGFTAGYEFNLKEGATSSTPSAFKLDDVEMCLGTMLVKYIDAIFAHVSKVIDPLDKVFGPNGLFLKPIPGMSKVFGSNFNLLKVTNYFCELTSDCNIKTLVEAIEVFGKIISVVDAAEELTQLGVEGCGVAKAIGSFKLALEQPVLAPDDYLPPKTKELIYKSMLAREHELEISSFVHSVTTTGHFGVVYNILQDPVTKLMDLMMGVNFPIVGVSIPTANMALGAYIPIPIYGPVPYVVISLQFKAALTVDFGEVSLTYDAVYDAIHYKQPSYLFRGLALTAKNPDGSPHYPIVASASLTGEVTVGILIFEGYGYVGLAVAVNLGYNNPTGGEVITFDQIARLVKAGGLSHALAGELTLTFNYGLGIRACIHFIVHKCWRIVSWGGHTTLFSTSFAHGTVPTVASGSGAVNLGLVSSSAMVAAGAALPTFSVDTSLSGDLWFAYDSASAGVGSALPTRSLAVGAAPVVSLVGSAGGPFLLLPRTGATAFALPATPLAHLELPMSYFPSASVFTASALKVAAASTPGVSLGSTCGSVSLTSPVPLSVVVLQGAVCPLTAAIGAGSNVSISGTPAAFHGHPVHVTGVGGTAAFVSLEASTFELTSGGVTADGFALTFDAGAFLALDVSGTLSGPVVFTVTSVAPGVATSVSGGNNADTFEVPEVFDLDSLVNVDGAGGTGNTLTVNMGSAAAFADVMADVVLGGSSGGSTHGVGFSNVQTVNVNLAPSGSAAAVYAAIPTAGTSLNVAVTSDAADGLFEYDLRGCTTTSALTVAARGSAGRHIVHLGLGAESLAKYECTVSIASHLPAASGVVELHVHASHDVRSLVWALDDAGLKVTDTSGVTAGVTVEMAGVDRAVLFLGGGATVVTHHTPSIPIEVVYSGNGTSSGAPAQLAVTAAAASILVNGTVGSVAVGVAGKHPLDALAAPLLLAASSGTQVNLTTATGAAAPAQWFSLASRSVFKAAVNTGAHVAAAKAPTAWLVEAAGAAGLTLPSGALGQIVYAAAPAYTLSVATGSGNDGLLGAKVENVRVVADLGSGIDLFDWLEAGDRAAVAIDMGAGVDFVNVVGPVNSGMEVVMGDDGVADVAVFWAPESMNSLAPSLLTGDTVVPCGFTPPGGEEPVMHVAGLTTSDSMTLARGEAPMVTYPWLSGYYGGSPSVVNVTAPVGGHLSFDLASHAQMNVVMIPTSAVVTFSAASAVEPGKVAESWVLDVALPDLSAQRSISVSSEVGRNGTVVVHVPEGGPGVVYAVTVTDLGYGGYGRVTVGGLRLTLQNTDVVVVDATSAPTTVTMGASANGEGMPTAVVVDSAESVVVPGVFAFPVVAHNTLVTAAEGSYPLRDATAPLVLVGGLTRAVLASDASVSLDRYCVDTADAVAKTAVSALVIETVLVSRFNVGHGGASGAGAACGALVLDIGTLEVSGARNVSVSGAGGGVTVGQVVVSGTNATAVAVEVDGAADGAAWASAHVASGTDGVVLSVESAPSAAFAPAAVFEVQVGVGSVSVGAGVFVGEGATLGVACNGGEGATGTVDVGVDGDVSTLVRVNGGGCSVAVAATCAGTDNVPVMAVSGAGAGVGVVAAMGGGESSVKVEEGEVVAFRDAASAAAAAVRVRVEDGAEFVGIDAVVGVGGASVYAESEPGFAQAYMRGGGEGNVPSVTFVGEVEGVVRVGSTGGAATGVILDGAKVGVQRNGVLDVEYCGDEGCEWSCYGSWQCSAAQLRADSMFGGPCNDAPELGACVASAAWRVVGVVGPWRKRAGLECSAEEGSVTLGGREGRFDQYSAGRVYTVVACAFVVVLGTIGGLVASERGVDYGLGHVFYDRMGWARFVVFALVSRNKLTSWSAPTVDVVASGYQMVADLGLGECSDVQPAARQEKLWVAVTCALLVLSTVAVCAFGAAHWLATQRRVSVYVWVARCGRAALGVGLFGLMVPAVANALRAPMAVVFLGVALGMMVAGVVGDVGRMRLLVVKAGEQIAVDSGSGAAKTVSVCALVVCVGTAFVAALFGGRSRSALPLYGSLVLWCVGACGELIVPVYALVSRQNRSVGWTVAAQAVATTVVSSAVGGTALGLLSGRGNGAVFGLWLAAFVGQWVSAVVGAVRSARVAQAVEGRRVGVLQGQRFDPVQVALLGGRGIGEIN